MSAATSLAFQIFYRLLYFFLCLVLLCFLIVTPADLIHQGTDTTEHATRRVDILLIALCYFVTISIVVFVCAFRLYKNRSVLASIPRPYIIFESGDVPKDVRAMVTAGLARSAEVAYIARPRLPLLSVRQVTVHGQPETILGRMDEPRNASANAPDDAILGLETHLDRSVWGKIEHPGCASPTSPDLPNLQYFSIISELVNLIEAKVLTLAPPGPVAQDAQPVLDAEAVGLLQRRNGMGLREYLAHLAELGVLEPLPLINDFIARYEYARFSTRPLSEARFRDLMQFFAALLRQIRPLDLAAMEGSLRLADDDSFNEPQSGSDIDNDVLTDTASSTPASSRRLSLRRASRHWGGPGPSKLARHPSSSTTSSVGTSRHTPAASQHPSLVVRTSSANTWQQYRIAPTTPKSTTLKRALSSHAPSFSPSSSLHSFAQIQQPPEISTRTSRNGAESPSIGSIRSVVSGDGSVIIRLTDSHGRDKAEETQLHVFERSGSRSSVFVL